MLDLVGNPEKRFSHVPARMNDPRNDLCEFDIKISKGGKNKHFSKRNFVVNFFSYFVVCEQRYFMTISI